MMGCEKTRNLHEVASAPVCSCSGAGTIKSKFFWRILADHSSLAKTTAYGQSQRARLLPGEDLLTRAQIEFEEEVGFRPEGVLDWIALGWIKQKGGKIVHAWAFEGDLPESFEPKSNLFEMEWPPHSGKRKMFPEVDQARFFSEEVARRKIKPTQVPFLDRLQAAIKG